MLFFDGVTPLIRKGIHESHTKTENTEFHTIFAEISAHPEISAHQTQWFFKGGSTQNRWALKGDFSKGGVHETDGFWLMIFQREGECIKPMAAWLKDTGTDGLGPRPLPIFTRPCHRTLFFGMGWTWMVGSRGISPQLNLIAIRPQNLKFNATLLIWCPINVVLHFSERFSGRCYMSQAPSFANDLHPRCATERVEAVTSLDMLYNDFFLQTMKIMESTDMVHGCGKFFVTIWHFPSSLTSLHCS